MNKAISASEASQSFSKILREVAEGQTFTVMWRGRAVARVCGRPATGASVVWQAPPVRDDPSRSAWRRMAARRSLRM